MSHKIQIITTLILIILGVVLNFNCKTAPENSCPGNTICSDSGLCTCPQFYYGQNCEKMLTDSKNLKINTSGFTMSGFLAVVVGLIVSFPTILIIGLLIIFYALKDRDY